MKTRWSTDSLYKRYGARGASEWVAAKRRALEARHAVPWTTYQAHGKQVFFPYLAGDTVPDECAARVDLLAERIRACMPSPFESFYVTFLQLHEKTGWNLRTIMSGAKALLRDGRATVTVGRMGRAVAIRMKEA